MKAPGPLIGLCAILPFSSCTAGPGPDVHAGERLPTLAIDVERVNSARREALHSNDHEAVREAILALAHSGCEVAFEPIAQELPRLVNRDAADLACLAIDVLIELDPEAAAVVLQGSITEDSPELARLAFAGLGRIDGTLASDLTTRLQRCCWDDSSWNVRRSAYRLLEELSPEQASELVVSSYERNDRRLRGVVGSSPLRLALARSRDPATAARRVAMGLIRFGGWAEDVATLIRDHLSDLLAALDSALASESLGDRMGAVNLLRSHGGEPRLSAPSALSVAFRAGPTQLRKSIATMVLQVGRVDYTVALLKEVASFDLDAATELVRVLPRLPTHERVLELTLLGAVQCEVLRLYVQRRLRNSRVFREACLAVMTSHLGSGPGAHSSGIERFLGVLELLDPLPELRGSYVTLSSLEEESPLRARARSLLEALDRVAGQEGR